MESSPSQAKRAMRLPELNQEQVEDISGMYFDDESRVDLDVLIQVCDTALALMERCETVEQELAQAKKERDETVAELEAHQNARGAP
jgi:hypothetical protein